MPALKRILPLTAAQKKHYAQSEAPLVDKRVVAADLRVGLRTVERWVKAKKIPYIRIGHRMLRFRLDAVRAAIARWETKEVS
jgi:excisionase family DNA binding protein